MRRKGQAGYSAYRRARRLRAAHLKSALKWGGLSSLASTAGSSTYLGGLSVGSLVAGGATGVATAVWRHRKPGEWRRWLQGAKAEQRTGRQLDRVKRMGWGVLHDRAIPRSKANLDHVVIHPSGKFLVYIDTKAWHAKNARIKWDGHRLMYGPWNKTDKMQTVEWEASRLHEETGLPVVAIIACDRGNVIGPPATPGVIQVGDTYVVNSDTLCRALVSMDQLDGSNPDRVRQVKRDVERKFPAAR